MPFVVLALNTLRQTLVGKTMRLIAHVALLAASPHPRLSATCSNPALNPFRALQFHHTNISEKHSNNCVVGYMKHANCMYSRWKQVL